MPPKDSAEKASRNIRGIADKPPIRTFPFDFGFWFSKAV